MKFTIHTDGGARGNPGPAAIGVVIEPINPINSTEPINISKRIGKTTNNVAEYTAVIEALKNIKFQISNFKLTTEDIQIQFYLDSNLVVNQLNGTFKVKEADLRNLLMQIRLLEQEVGGVIQYSYVPREQNRRADSLVNKALDNY